MYTINETIGLLNDFLSESKKDVDNLNKLNIAAQNIVGVLKDKNYPNTSFGQIELYLKLDRISKENKNLHDVISKFKLYDTNETMIVHCAIGPVSVSEFGKKTKYTNMARQLTIRSHISNIILDNPYITDQRIKEIDDKLLEEFVDIIENSIMKRLKSELGELLREKINNALPNNITKDQ